MIQEATYTECFIFLNSYFPVYCVFIERKILITQVSEDALESDGLQCCSDIWTEVHWKPKRGNGLFL